MTFRISFGHQDKAKTGKFRHRLSIAVEIIEITARTLIPKRTPHGLIVSFNLNKPETEYENILHRSSGSVDDDKTVSDSLSSF